MDKYVELIKLLESIFGKGSVSRTIGTRTNVVRFPKGKQPIDPTRGNFDVEGTAAKNPDLVQTIENSIEDRMGDITKMNDQELLTYTANVRRLANFKQPPVQNADVIKFGSGEEIKGEGLEQLIQKQGTKFPPTTDIGKLEATGKRLEKLGEDFAKEFDPANDARLEAERLAMIERQYEGKGYAGGVFGPSGKYRAVARNFLLDEAAKGKIKLSPDTIKNLEERNYISGGQPLMYADPIRIMRYHYGDDVFEKIPLDKIPTGAPSEIRDVMSKVEAAPIKTEAPKTPGGYLTPGEYRANIEELQGIENAIKRRESRFADMTEEEIQNELAQYGGKRSAFEMALEQDYPEEFAKYKKPEPEEKADGGIIGRRGMFLGGFLSRLINSNPQIVSALKEQPASDVPLTLQERYRKYLSEAETPPDTSSPIGGLIGRFLKGSGIATPQTGSTSANDFLYNLYKKNLEQKADGGRIGYKGGKRVLSDIDKLIEKLNKKTQGKKSMESVNPKTGEVTIPKKPIRRAEEPTGTTVMDAEPEIVDERSIKKNKSRQLTKEEIEDYSEQLGDTETWLSEGTVEEAEKALKRRKAEEAYYYGQYKMGKLDPAPGEQTEARMKFLQKKLEEAEMTKDRRLISPSEIDELMSLENTFAKDLAQSGEQALENEMNRVLNQYDKSMFIKDAQGMVDVSNPANAEKMALLLKRDHPEIYNKIFKLTEDINQKQTLEDFDITGREPNAKGGIAGLL